jgi:hypothetical protein
MSISVRVNLTVLNDTMGDPRDAQEYLDGLRTEQVQYLNGPESPKVCTECLSYHGVVSMRSDSSRPLPPMHPNCYCREVTYRGQSQTVRPARAYRPGEYLTSQVRRLSLAEREVLMGKGVARLHRLGIVRTEQLVSGTDGILTLETHLRRHVGISNAQLARMTDGELLAQFNKFQLGKKK